MKLFLKSVPIILALAVIAVSFGLSGSRAEARDRAQGDRIPGQYIVVFKDGAVGDSDEDSIIGAFEKKHRFTRDHEYRSVVRGFAAKLSDDAVTILKDDPRVAYVAEDRTVSIDTTGDARVLEAPRASARGAATVQATQSIPTGVNRIDAENKANKGAGVQVAVIDTGIDYTHPDLAANVIGGKNCSTGTSYKDGNGHGTHVAGTIAAVNNTQGVVGVAPAAKLWAVRVLNNQGSGSWSQVICGLDFVTSKAPKNGGSITVASLSLGGTGTSDNNCGNTNNDPLHQAICRARDAGVTVVVAAGNNAGDTAQTVPAAYNDAVITVSALADSDGASGGLGAATAYGADDTFATFSNYGSAVDIGAPGVNITSTWPGNRYAILSGTSMATPHVSGAAALYIAGHPGATWTQVRDALVALGEPVGPNHTDPSALHAEPVLKANAL